MSSASGRNAAPKRVQASPGVFNENTFRALDWLLDEARLHGLRVVLSFVDNWKYPGDFQSQVMLRADWSNL